MSDAKRTFHIGIKKDKARGVYPLSFLVAGGVTFHSFSSTYSQENEAHLITAGKVERIDVAQLEKIKKDLTVDRRPIFAAKPVQMCADDEPRLAGYLVRERRMPDGRLQREYRDMPYGRGRVLQWKLTENGWNCEQVRLEDHDYQPVGEPSTVKNDKGETVTVYLAHNDKGVLVAEEVPVSSLVYMQPALDPNFAPPAIDMRELDHEAEKIEAEEEAKDPVAFEKAQARARRAKAQGTLLEPLSS